jgi:Zn-dependent oligopeptidase
MLESWCWNKESLKLMSAHYKDASSIDEKLLDDLIKSKNASSGVFNMRFLLFNLNCSF